MAQYTIVTTREQEAGLNYSFEHYASEGQTKNEFLQGRVSHTVLNPMFVEFKGSQAVALDKSIATIPQENEAKASLEIQAVIVDNGGQIVPAGPPPNPIPGLPGGTLPASRGTIDNPIQAGGTDKTDDGSGGGDESGNNTTETGA